MRYSKGAEKAVKERRIAQLILQDNGSYVFIFLAREKGVHKDHIVGPNFCDCESFVFSKLLGYDRLCVHAQTYELASQREDFVKIIVKKQEYKEILNEIFTYGKSLKLRKLMRSRNE